MALALFLIGPTAQAGKLDLNIYADMRWQAAPRSAQPSLSALDWKPGDPRNLRGENRSVQTLVSAAQTGMGIAGFVACLAVAPAAAAGFAVVAAVSAYRLYKSAG